MSKQTGSFIVILVIASIGGIAALKLNKQKLADVSTQAEAVSPVAQPQAEAKPETAPKPEVSGETDTPPVDTSSWKTYTSRNYPFSFKYPADWKVSPTPTNDEFDLITITSPKDKAPIHIFLSKKDYVGMTDLKTEPMTVGGQDAIDVQHALVGVKYNNVFYTFDLGNALNEKPEFKALLNSVVFSPPK